jgi:hypothetical protein
LSHQTKIKTKLTDLAALREAAKFLGFTEFRENSTWDAYSGKSRRKADLVMKHPGHRLEVGVVKEKDGSYSINTDYYEGIGRVVGQNAERLIQEWTKISAIEAAQLDGFFVEEQVEEQTGTITLKCSYI